MNLLYDNPILDLILIVLPMFMSLAVVITQIMIYLVLDIQLTLYLKNRGTRVIFED